MKRSIHLLSVMLFIFASNWASAKFRAPQQTPVDRLLHTAKEYLKQHPDEAEAHYTLGRIYYLAFSVNRDVIPAFPNDDKTGNARMAEDWMAVWSPPGDGKKTSLSEGVLLDYARQARREFDEAIRLAPKNGLYYLGRGCLLEEVRKWEATAKAGDRPTELQGITITQIRRDYEKAFSLEIGEDSKNKGMPVPGLGSLVSYEAASNLMRLSADKQFQGTEEHDAQIAKEAMAKLEKLPRGIVTPIVFSFFPCAHLSELLAPGTIVDFDLRGYGGREQWTWVKPALGILVWDPLHTGKITSARQLFGSYSFQIFRATGYDALAALDDNGDGVLSGIELKGISVWFDWNSNGVSDPREVTPVEDLHIRAIATTAHEMDRIHPTNAAGITLDDGRTYRTWDWITQPLPAPTIPKLALAEQR